MVNIKINTEKIYYTSIPYKSFIRNFGIVKINSNYYVIVDEKEIIIPKRLLYRYNEDEFVLLLLKFRDIVNPRILKSELIYEYNPKTNKINWIYKGLEKKCVVKENKLSIKYKL